MSGKVVELHLLPFTSRQSFNACSSIAKRSLATLDDQNAIPAARMGGPKGFGFP
jgi:hypothetical protein